MMMNIVHQGICRERAHVQLSTETVTSTVSLAELKLTEIGQYLTRDDDNNEVDNADDAICEFCDPATTDSVMPCSIRFLF